MFIGMGLREAELRAALDACLCTAWELVSGVDEACDPFAPWPPIASMLPDAEEDSADEGMGSEDAGHDVPSGDLRDAVMCDDGEGGGHESEA